MALKGLRANIFRPRGRVVVAVVAVAVVVAVSSFSASAVVEEVDFVGVCGATGPDASRVDEDDVIVSGRINDGRKNEKHDVEWLMVISLALELLGLIGVVVVVVVVVVVYLFVCFMGK